MVSDSAPNDHLNNLFQQRLIEMRRPVIINRKKMTSTPALQLIGDGVEALGTFFDTDGEVKVLLSGGESRLALVSSYPTAGQVFASVISDEGGTDAQDFARTLFARLGPPALSATGEVRFGFWHAGGNGAACRPRALMVPTWDSISDNYAKHARESLESLMTFDPAQLTEQSGRLVLLHGPPGTGKTTAIRALARSWSHWCNPHYVVDPEKFFGSADYMVTVLLELSSRMRPPVDLEFDDDDDLEVDSEAAAPPPAPWNLLIIEDADELLSGEAKDKTGQGFSRLLNIGDGLIGQGLRVMVLLTSNVPMSSLNKAVTRPGRCLADIEVPKFPALEAAEWLGTSSGERTLAELYEARSKMKISAPVKEYVRPGQYL